MKLPAEEIMEVGVRARARRFGALVLAFFPLLVFSGALSAQVGKPGTTTVVPDQFLRRWDPVTIFFAAPTGPAAGGPEGAPARYVNLEPSQPGAFTWLDARTLQFRPADPWPPLAGVSVKVEGKSFRLVTLMAAPTASQPANGAEGLPPYLGNLELRGRGILCRKAALQLVSGTGQRPREWMPWVAAHPAEHLDGRADGAKRSGQAGGRSRGGRSLRRERGGGRAQNEQRADEV